MPENFDIAELKRLRAAAMGCPHSLGEGAKPVHELTNYLTTHLSDIIAMGAKYKRAEELNAASHDMMMKANARLTAERDALARALAAIVDTNPANPYSWRTWLGEHTEALKIARRVAG